MIVLTRKKQADIVSQRYQPVFAAQHVLRIHLHIIPGSSYPAYARDCIAESPLCFTLGTPETNALFARIESARQFWAMWDENPWPDMQQEYLDAITSVLGPVKNYYGIVACYLPK